jgi:hypothetical protein
MRVAALNVSGPTVEDLSADFGTEAERGRLHDFVRFTNSHSHQNWTEGRGPCNGGGVPRLTIKSGSARTPGSEGPHIEVRDPTNQRTDPFGNPVAKQSPGNHYPYVP